MTMNASRELPVARAVEARLKLGVADALRLSRAHPRVGDDLDATALPVAPLNVNHRRP